MNNYNHNNTQSCSYCGNREGIFVHNRHASWGITLLLSMLFLTFIVGYFWGKKAATANYMLDMQVMSQADREQVASYSMASVATDDIDSMVVSTVSQENFAEKNTPEKLILLESVQPQVTVAHVDTCPVVSQIDESSSDEQRYYAQLIGFGTKRAAQKFVDKLKTNDVPVCLRERTSVSAKGKSITWYQVVTAEFSSRDKLAELVDQISAQEKLSDVRIVSC